MLAVSNVLARIRNSKSEKQSSWTGIAVTTHIDTTPDKDNINS